MIDTKEQNQIKELVNKLDLKHIAIIMDGNRRWAKERMLPSAMGHKKGVESLKDIVKSAHKFGIKYITVYAFSTENWKRPEEEVTFLMELLATTIANEVVELDKNNVKLKFIGDLNGLSKKLQKILKDAEEKTKNNNGVNLQIAINYGSRLEITNAIKEIIKKGYKEEEINEEIIKNHLYTKNIPDPDLLIRTGGEKRISNYLLWQIAYSEILVTNVYWPDFKENELTNAIKEFSERQRRYGK
ncbi:MAG: isoprenyl transferase [Cyanobacteria bacterium SIG30]|nr:isoprenyl transferase [Cyanobacteria bacterium SIG30]